MTKKEKERKSKEWNRTTDQTTVDTQTMMVAVVITQAH